MAGEPGLIARRVSGLLARLVAVSHAVVPDAATRVRRAGNIFQRLDDLADLFVDAGLSDLRSILELRPGSASWRSGPPATCSRTTTG